MKIKTHNCGTTNQHKNKGLNRIEVIHSLALWVFCHSESSVCRNQQGE